MLDKGYFALVRPYDSKSSANYNKMRAKWPELHNQSPGNLTLR